MALKIELESSLVTKINFNHWMEMAINNERLDMVESIDQMVNLYGYSLKPTLLSQFFYFEPKSKSIKSMMIIESYSCISLIKDTKNVFRDCLFYGLYEPAKIVYGILTGCDQIAEPNTLTKTYIAMQNLLSIYNRIGFQYVWLYENVQLDCHHQSKVFKTHEELRSLKVFHPTDSGEGRCRIVIDFNEKKSVVDRQVEKVRRIIQQSKLITSLYLSFRMDEKTIEQVRPIMNLVYQDLKENTTITEYSFYQPLFARMVYAERPSTRFFISSIDNVSPQAQEPNNQAVVNSLVKNGPETQKEKEIEQIPNEIDEDKDNTIEDLSQNMNSLRIDQEFEYYLTKRNFFLMKYERANSKYQALLEKKAAQ
ncbi:hypothetical protein DFA_00157 [Cavenderia fasciculata]|uniref:Uncharacterized protein n=1 Tax=Cavenderia fasciculata TaxID=261658 RepID=F4PXR9_CACFS|nr:uncharacterized protein DFA_00157 [Cavenderia fasciculata]EGG19579.1 hypothetical protein DFA_00157 [Cavenderia fasciculata]|eukprot:XP_004357873.1 hypothetical protein DFA_00157 [Cavenderia fasciculata]